jgi:poly-gamma-glutamate synthesis protein (capsule biosynthesis protein)
MTIWLSPTLPNALRDELEESLAALDIAIELVENPQVAQLRIEPNADHPLTAWIYALVTPFPSLQERSSLDDLRAIWSGSGDPSIVVHASESTAAALAGILGTPGEASVAVVREQDLLEVTWATRPSWALVPFEALEPRWKVLEIDGASPVRYDFDPQSAPLVVWFGLSGDPTLVQLVKDSIAWPTTNRDPTRLTTLVMTGTTALVRSTAWKMERNGVSYPGEKIGSWLRDADLAHVSNEVAFTTTCPPPDPFQVDLRFCSSPEYLGLFEQIGVDLVELTGNHINDWGSQALLESLDHLQQGGWMTFGGGKDLESSFQPALIEHHGNRFAFLGCNSAGPSRVWATEDSPGVAPCDMTRFYPELERLRGEGYLPIFTFQWAESAIVLSSQSEAFRGVIDAGAVIVSGSQAHRSLGMEFYHGGFIHYGLGNLFFDQMQALELRQEMIDRHLFYDGRHINTELLTALLEDFAQPRPMTPEEREAFLRRIFAASGW